MALTDSILKFLGSKYFTLFLGIAMACAIPFTWHNVQVVFQFKQASRYWYLIAVFVVNVLAVGLCAFKFLSAMTSQKKVVTSEEW